MSSNLGLVFSKFNLRMNKSLVQRIYEFADFRFDAEHLMLYRGGESIPLAPKAAETLLVFIERRGQILSKEELIEQIWPDASVEESNLFLYLSILRKTLGNQNDGKPWIETLRRRGYRFGGEVVLVQEETSVKHGSSKTTQSGRVYVVRDWESNATQSPRIGPASSALPALKSVEPSNGLALDEVSNLPREEQTEDAQSGLAGNAVSFRHPRFRYVFAIALGAILLSVILAGSVHWRSRLSPVANINNPKTVAILPFRPLVPEHRDEALEQGMADELITRLCKNSAIHVLPLSSVRSFVGPEYDARQAGETLKADLVLDGSLQRSGGRVRANVRLIHVSNGTAIWAESFEGESTDIIHVQVDIARKIVGALALQLAGDERTRLEKRFTSNADAQDSYHRGRYHMYKMTEENLRQSIAFYESAIKADPNFALAYANLADSYLRLAIPGFASAKDVLPRAKEAAEKALELDETLAVPYMVLAEIDITNNWDRKSAEIKRKRAIDLDPHNADARVRYAFSLVSKSPDEAVAEAKRGRELEPASQIVLALEGQVLLWVGHVDEAILRLRKALEFDPNFWVAHLHLGSAYHRQKRYNEAIAEFEKAREFAPGSPLPLLALWSLYGETGDKKRAFAIRNEIEKLANTKYVPLHALAGIYYDIGQKDKALDLLEKSLEEREMHLIGAMGQERWVNLRSDPRFQEILRKMNMNPK